MQTNTDTVPATYRTTRRTPSLGTTSGNTERGNSRAAAEDRAPSVMNASESGPSREGTLSTDGDPADDPKMGKRRLPGQGRFVTSHPLPGTRQHPNGVSS
jgi:hypothetical protein